MPSTKEPNIRYLINQTKYDKKMSMFKCDPVLTHYENIFFTTHNQNNSQTPYTYNVPRDTGLHQPEGTVLLLILFWQSVHIDLGNCTFSYSWCQSLHRPWFNIKVASYQYRKSHCGDNIMTYLLNRISYTGKVTSLYWVRALEYCYIFSSPFSSGYGLSQWDKTLVSNASSHWWSPYSDCFLPNLLVVCLHSVCVKRNSFHFGGCILLVKSNWRFTEVKLSWWKIQWMHMRSAYALSMIWSKNNLDIRQDYHIDG